MNPISITNWLYSFQGLLSLKNTLVTQEKKNTNTK